LQYYYGEGQSTSYQPYVFIFYCKGWTFDGESGKNMEIPQAVIAQHNKQPSPNAAQKDTTKLGREDATPIATHVSQGMVWLQPSYTSLEALAAMESGKLSPPPRVPEMDIMEGYKSTTVVRDFPIDWTVLMENIMDPDHGKLSLTGYVTSCSFCADINLHYYYCHAIRILCP
jgi:phenylpropionate dioxygenase-like ring-hydroxylating dioxygenase large terminal subunit